MPTFALEVEYAKSNRATCKQCKEKIDKDAVRLGLKTVAEDGGEGGQASHMMEAVKWHHFACLPKARGAAWFKKNFGESADEAINGIAALKDADQEAVRLLFKACRGEGPVPNDPAGDTTTQQVVTPSQPSGKKRKSSGKAAADEEPATKRPMLTKSGFTPEQAGKIEAIRMGLNSKSVQVLGIMLAKNGMPKTGKREELLEKVAECKALGVPPMCTACEKVRMKWSGQKGQFCCNGYFDADEKVFKRCKGPEDVSSLTREAWVELDN